MRYMRLLNARATITTSKMSQEHRANWKNKLADFLILEYIHFFEYKVSMLFFTVFLLKTVPMLCTCLASTRVVQWRCSSGVTANMRSGRKGNVFAYSSAVVRSGQRMWSLVAVVGGRRRDRRVRRKPKIAERGCKSDEDEQRVEMETDDVSQTKMSYHRS